ncbi:hypothetical protein [Bradyrhizobium lablabi]|uniref:hypothetical protein n=1 Tax=Bradyrhizobium lablabi TaxID=722472 RepID=UPI00094443E4|nr:hypothetical protein [Bradyrhizobium lablabi]
MSSQAPAPSASPAPAPAAASPPTPSSPDGTTSQQVDRPEGIPDSYWDPEAKALKVDPAALAKDLKERDELKTFKAAEDVRRGSLPQKADDYKLELPSDFKPPAGVDYKLDAANPALGQLKAVAHKHGLTQDAVTEILGLYAGNEVGTQAAIASARNAEIAKLGPTAPARVDAVTNWLAGIDSSADKGDAKALAGMLVTARHVEAFERIINKLTSQGTASFSQSHRVAPDDKSIPGFENMSFAQKRFAQDQAAARRTG